MITRLVSLASLLRIEAVIASMAPPFIFMGSTPLMGGLVTSSEARMWNVVAIAFAVGVWLACAILAAMSRSKTSVARSLLVGSVLSSMLNLAGIVFSFVAVIGLVTVFTASFLISLPILILAIWNR